MASVFEAVAREIEVTQGVNEALMRFCRVMSCALPIEGAFIGKHLPETQEVIYLARTSLDESRSLHVNVPICDDVQQYLVSKKRPEACAYYLKTFPPLLHLNKSIIPVDRSYMEIRLRAGDTPIGMLGLYAKKGQSFDNEQYEQLMLDVRKPLAQAVTMHLFKKGLFRLPDESHSFSDDAVLNEHEVLSRSDVMKHVLQKIDVAAPLSHTVLLLGETGVGKEVLARRLHARSKYARGPFIHVNCGALPETLVDSELFGHEKGAFTGADARHIGFFEQANGGTIFLDEIGELPACLQSRLLLTLQDKTICRVGGRQRVPLDFRVVAATNRNLSEMVSARTFRQDLFYRLNALTIEVPALRQRKDDIPILIKHFIEKTARSLGLLQAPGIPQDILQKWMCYHWPGNIRELSNHVEQMLIFGSSSLMDERADAHSSQEKTQELEPQPEWVRPELESSEVTSLRQYTRLHIQKVLEKTHGRVAGPDGAAEILQVHPSTLRSRMKKLGIQYGRRYRLR